MLTPSSRLSPSLRRAGIPAKLSAIGEQRRFLDGTSGGGRGRQLRGEGKRIAGRARLVVGDIEDVADLAGKGRVDRLRNVGDVDAVEDLAGLDDPARVSLFDLDQGILSGSVDAGEAQDGNRGAAPCAVPLPRALGIKACAAARRARLWRRGLVDPFTAVVAVDADRRQINDRAQVARVRQRIAKSSQHGIAVLVRRNRDQRAVGVADGAGYVRVRGGAVEDERL